MPRRPESAPSPPCPLHTLERQERAEECKLQTQECYRKHGCYKNKNATENLGRVRRGISGRGKPYLRAGKAKVTAPKSGATQLRAVHTAQEGEKVAQPGDHGSNDVDVTTDNGNDRVDVVKEPSFGN